MMTNGSMKESCNKEGVLDDVEPVIFALLAKFAYFGLCGVVGGLSSAAHKAAKFSPEVLDLQGFRCVWCGINQSVAVGSTPVFYPFCGIDCRRQSKRSKSAHAVPNCVVYNCSEGTTGYIDNNNLCQTHQSEVYTRIYDPDSNCWNDPRIGLATSVCSTAFARRQYPCGSMSHQELNKFTNQYTSATASSDIDPLVQHAKLYALADRYMVNDLKSICLYKLYRELTAFNITDDSIEHVTDLLLYSYSHTNYHGDIVNGTSDGLRSLVMAFITDNSKALMKYKGFRTVLAAGGEHTADFWALNFNG